MRSTTLTLLSLATVATTLDLSLTSQNMTCEEKQEFISVNFMNKIDDFGTLEMTAEQTDALNAGMCNLSCEEFMNYAHCVNDSLTALKFQECTVNFIPGVFE